MSFSRLPIGSEPSESSCNQSLAWVMGNGGKGHMIITFPFALDSGWYSEQVRTDFLRFEHRKERKGFKHEFIVLRLTSKSLCRIERVGDPNARLNSISSRGSTAYDMAQTFSEEDTAHLKTSDVVAEITLPFEFDIMDVLKVCRAIHEGETTRNYTLQVYNCWFFSLAIQVCLARLIAYWEDPELLESWLSKLREGIDALIEHPELGRLLQTQKIFKIYPMLAPLGSDGEKSFMEEVGARLKSRLMDLSGDLRAEIRCRINDLLWYSTIRAYLSGFVKEQVKVTIVELLQERFLTIPDSYHSSAKSLEQLKHQLLELWTSLLRSSGTRTSRAPTQFRLKNLKQKPVHPARDILPRGRSSELGILPKSAPAQFQLKQKKPVDRAARGSLIQYLVSKLGALSESTPTQFQPENGQEQANHAAHGSPRGVSKLVTLSEFTTIPFQPENEQEPVDRTARDSPRSETLSESTPTQLQLEKEQEQADRDHAAHDSPHGSLHDSSKLASLPESTRTRFQPENKQGKANHTAHGSPHSPIKLAALPESTTTHFLPENEKEPTTHATHGSPLRGGISKLGAQYTPARLLKVEGNIHRFITRCKPYLGQVLAWLLDAISLIWGITILAPHVVSTIDQQLEAFVTELEGLGEFSCSDLEKVIQTLCALAKNQAGLWFNSPWDNVCSFLEEYALDDILKELFKPKVDFFAKYGSQEKSDSETIVLFQDHILERIKIHAQEVERNWLGSAVDLQAQLEDVLSLVWKRIREDESLTEKVSNMKPFNQKMAMSEDVATLARTDRPTDATPPSSEPPNRSPIVLEDILAPAQTATLDRPADTTSPSSEPPNQSSGALKDVLTPDQPDWPTGPPECPSQSPIALEDIPTPSHIDGPTSTTCTPPSPEPSNQISAALEDILTQTPTDRQTDTISPSPEPPNPVALEDNRTPTKRNGPDRPMDTMSLLPEPPKQTQVIAEKIVTPTKKGNMNARFGIRKTIRSWISSSSSPPVSSSSGFSDSSPSMPVPQPASSSFRDSLQIPRPARPRSRALLAASSIPENENYALSSLATQCALTLSEVAKEIAPIPAVGELVGCLKRVFQAVERSKVNKDQWKLLRGRCVMVLRIAGAHVDNYGKDQYPNLDEAAALLQITLNRIEERARYYNEMDELVAFVLHQSISDEIRALFAELDACLALFNFTAEGARKQWTEEYQAIQRRESSELQRLRRELEKLNINFDSLRQNQGELLEKTNKMVDALQQVLVHKSMILQDQTTATVASYVDAQQLVRTILSVTGLRLPPKLLLGKQCILDAPIPIKTGIACDTYSASFLGEEKVAKKVFRIGISDQDYVEKYATRFLRIATLWSDFRSDYTLPFYGIGMDSSEEDNFIQLYMISPLMKNFDAVTIIMKLPVMHHTLIYSTDDIPKTITDAAKGLQYLHNRSPPVVHAGMRGNKILITESEGGILGGFRLAQALESVANNKIPPAVMDGETESQRWMAPEMFMDDPPLETPCDLWGWAMATLEIVSGSIPYHTHKQAMTIILKISSGPPRREHHPKFEEYAHRPDEMWELLQRCWAMEPSERPTIDEVVERLEQIAKMPEVGA
ncbi:unnamed protein product [Rhizoctonia solani]|uniref:Protein kinase domain-containing protein n=1 Tax=Rhizoctonia solani TaxID=456999 RepID=A0A8H3DX65_9AGAM|nr:unnamed protein product [Rhizoctonia solani]